MTLLKYKVAILIPSQIVVQKLPIVAIMILLIGNIIVRAFSIIWFRSAPGDSKDISCVLFSMAAGHVFGRLRLFQFSKYITVLFQK
ncbi:hypothetical protein [Paenibacillus sp. Soil522]|uniref:hypothetical protein n=1 Tax=Paenibacillus sp. Soil522 TaxID=1736388 RepID=UPI0006F91E4E|nr:hypothetical protein ASG81_20620 [Paenibacillus sp. Soil522]